MASLDLFPVSHGHPLQPGRACHTTAQHPRTRLMRPEPTQRKGAHGPGLRICGRLADVCAELERLAALEELQAPRHA